MSLYHKWLTEIQQNEKQLEAFQAKDSAVIIAGPGSGKTRVLSVKIAQLLRDEVIAPRGIACLTYTRMMAQELRMRLNSLGVLERPNIFIGTVHSFCLDHVINPFAVVRDLKIPKPIKIAPQKTWDICFDQARQKVNKERYDPSKWIDIKFKNCVVKYHLQSTENFSNVRRNKLYEDILNNHYKLLAEKGYIDFNLIVKTAVKLIANDSLVRQSIYAKFGWLAIDEYQDLGYPLSRIVTDMIQHTPIKIFVIGDPNQCIYDFAGTDPKYLIDLSKHPCVKSHIKLNKNYRSTLEIINISKSILKTSDDYLCDKNGGNFQVLETPPPLQSLWVSNLVQEYLNNGIHKSRIAVFHPRRKELKSIANELDKKQIEFTLDKNYFYDSNVNLIRWLEDLGRLCLTGFDLQDQNAGSKTFDDLVRNWHTLAYPQSLWYTQDNKIRLELVELIWVLKKQNTNLGDWLSRVTDYLEFTPTLKEYKSIYPDDFEALENLMKITRPDGILGKSKLSDFVNLTKGIQLTTLHSSKGMEFDAVIIAGVEKISDDENGKRLFYVGVTRAEREVCLIYSKEKYSNLKYINHLIHECSELSYFSHSKVGFYNSKI